MGMSFAFIDIPVVYAVLVIGFFTFALSVTGYFIGHKAGSFVKSKIEIIGGIILIGLGAKILIEHLL